MNRLQHETSPYLLQHKDNPVDWYPWGDEAFQKARDEDKAILLSVGYSACHWCHVMAHESFEHEPTAEMMNELFVNIKVDREERPDVDNIYMQAVQAMNRGQGGWPMTVFMLPNGRPFYGGTYYPREARMGMPSFRQVLEAVHEAFVNRRDDLEAQASSLTESIDRSSLNIMGAEDGLNDELLSMAAGGLQQNADRMNGGFGKAPKFPQPMVLEYLLRHATRSGDEKALNHVTFTLEQMARGGIYDQIGGGFHRYSVDAVWLVPHFEKMLYDNAQLSRLYLHAWQATDNDFFRDIAVDIYDYILREMTAPEGGFYSATDADSEGEEGKFFVWSLDELQDALDPISDELPNACDIAVEYWGMSKSGNFEGTNILHVPNEPDIVAERLDISEADLADAIQQIKDRLYAVRTSRVHPGLDDKILLSWNGMMLASLAEAGRVLKRDDYTAAAERAGNFLLDNMLTDEGRLLHTYKDGTAKINGYLEDYANLIDALLELYQATFIERYFTEARRLADTTLAHFRADEGGFFDTSDDHEKLITRPRQLQDNAVPSGNGMMAKQLLRLAAYTGSDDYDTIARRTLRLVQAAIQQYPQAFGEFANAADMAVTGMAEVAIVGNPTNPDTQALLDVVHQGYRPNTVIALARKPPGDEATIPLLSYRTLRNERPTAYVCRNFACQMPVNEPDAMLAQLNTNS